MGHLGLEYDLFASVRALIQCHEVMERFEGSEETLKLIQHVEEALKRLIVCMEKSQSKTTFAPRL